MEVQNDRFIYAKGKVQDAGFDIAYECETHFVFEFNGHKVTFYPYTGWATGKIMMGRPGDKTPENYYNETYGDNT